MKILRIEGQGIGYLDAMNLYNSDDINSILKQKPIDLIIDCTKNIPDKSLLSEIYNYQNEQNRCFVVILPLEKQTDFPEFWDLAPTKTEALDLISFGQIQRELNF